MCQRKTIYHAGAMALLLTASGCQSTGGWSLNPLAWSKNSAPSGSMADTSPQSTPAPSGVTGTVGQIAKGARGQVGTMGLAVKSAVGKTTSSVTGFLTSKSKTEGEAVDDPLSLANKAKSVSPEVFVANGQLWETTGNVEKAQEQYTKALEAEPNNPAALASVARLLEKQEKHDQAAEYFSKAITAAPNDAGLYNDLGLTYSKLGKHTEAVAQLQKAIAISPSTTRYANNLAVVQMNAGQTDFAMQTLTKAHDPSKAHYNMAWMYYQRQDMDGAREHLSQALKIDPNMDRAKELMEKIGSPRLASLAQNPSQVIQQTSEVANMAKQASQSAQGLFNLPPSLTTAPAAATPAPVVIPPAVTYPQSTIPAANSPPTASPMRMTLPNQSK